MIYVSKIGAYTAENGLQSLLFDGPHLPKIWRIWFLVNLSLLYMSKFRVPLTTVASSVSGYAAIFTQYIPTSPSGRGILQYHLKCEIFVFKMKIYLLSLFEQRTSTMLPSRTVVCCIGPQQLNAIASNMLMQQAQAHKPGTPNPSAQDGVADGSSVRVRVETWLWGWWLSKR